MSFFPQLVAGPIERASSLLPQFLNNRRVTNSNIQRGGLLILLGLFKKIAIADAVAPFVEEVFSAPASTAWPGLLLGSAFFAIQIYCDFSGYSDIARGCARLLGFELCINFNQPYFSRNIQEFWRRWHISLSTWLRDYLYIPMGGSHKGRGRTYINLLITMLLGGLWHGAAWKFVAWGGIHGALLSAHRLVFGAHPDSENKRSFHSIGFRLVSTCVTLGCVCMAWVFFRAENLSDALLILKRIVTMQGNVTGYVYHGVRFFCFLSMLLFVDVPQALAGKHEAMLNWHWMARGLACGLMVLLIILLGSDDQTPFIYFQF